MIARGLSAADPDGAAIAAGRVMLMRLRQLAEQRVSFAFETTLATRMFAPSLRDLRASGYAVHFFFLWLPSADFAIERVADRVRAGGHNVPAETVRRRYGAGLKVYDEAVWALVKRESSSATSPAVSPANFEGV